MSRVKINYFYLLLIIFLFLTFSYKTSAINQVIEDEINLEGRREPALILILVDCLDIEDILKIQTKNIDLIKENGAFGLINIRQADGYHPESIYLSLNTGNKCNKSKFVRKGIMDENRAVNPFINYIIDDNAINDYGPEIGYLGEKLRKNEVKIAALGNSDILLQKDRSVLSLAMDKSGSIDYGIINKLILDRVDYDWGYETNWDKMKDKFDEFTKKADLIIIDTGDLKRIDNFNINNNEYRNEKIQEIDNFIGYVNNKIKNKETDLAIISLLPTSNALKKGNKLGWALFSGEEYASGWLSSDSTKRKGIITIPDITVSILKKYNIRPKNIAANNIKFLKANTNWENLKSLKQRITTINNIRPFFVDIFIISQIVLLIISFLKRKYNKVIIKILFEYILLSLLFTPINFLIISKFSFFDIYYHLIILFIFSLTEVFILNIFIHNQKKKIFFILTLFFLIITIDIFNGYKLMADSILGYSSISGARYYGIGNEYMGMYLGVFILGITLLVTYIFEKEGKIYNKKFLISSVILYLIFIYILISPNLGANFGGSLTAILSFMIVIYFYFSNNPRIKLLSIFSIIFFILIFFLIYAKNMDSHIGRAFYLLENRNFEILKQIIIRKIKMNIKLFKWTIWSKLFIILLIQLIFLIIYPSLELKKIFEEYRQIKLSIYCILGASIATFFLNDSGVVASATLLFYPVMIFLYLANSYK